MDDYNTQSGQSTNYGESTGTGSAGTAARMKEQVSDKAADIKEKVSDFGRKAVEKIDNSRQSAADALDQTATSLHSGGDASKYSGSTSSSRTKSRISMVRVDSGSAASSSCSVNSRY